MDEIDKRIQNRYNIFNSNSINSNKEEKEKCKINLRKKKIQNIMMRKRYYDEYSNISSHNKNIKQIKKYKKDKWVTNKLPKKNKEK